MDLYKINVKLFAESDTFAPTEFVPIAIMEGRPGAFFEPLVLGYALAVGAAMLVALTVTPALSLTLFSRGWATQRFWEILSLRMSPFGLSAPGVRRPARKRSNTRSDRWSSIDRGPARRRRARRLPAAISRSPTPGARPIG